jgi:hypothetical protein
VVEVVLATVDKSDISGSKPHNRDPSGAASDYKRGFGPQTYRIELSRILLSVYPSTTTHAASFELLAAEQVRSKPHAREVLCTLFLLGSRWPR